MWYITLEGVLGLAPLWDVGGVVYGRRVCVGLREAFLRGHETHVCVGFRSKLCVVTWEVCMSAVCGVGYYIGNEHSSPERGGLDPSSLRGQILPPTVWTRCFTTVRETCHHG